MSEIQVPSNFNRIPLPLLTITKVALLEKSSNQPPFYILIESSNLSQQDSVVFYEIEFCLQDGKDAVLNRISRRYSQIEKFHQYLKKTLDPKITLPKLPPKKLFGNMSEEFIKERKEALQRYFDSVSIIPGITSIEAFQIFFEFVIMDKINGDQEALQRYEQAKAFMGL